MNTELENLEVRLLLEAVFERYGYDFRQYAPASIKRRVLGRLAAERLSSLSVLQDRVLRDPACMERLVLELTVHVSAMFRDPGFYRAFREKVVPWLQTYPFVRLWHAGCSTGEEVYSMAILLREEGLYDRCRLYATDLSAAVLDKARDGVFSLEQMQTYTENYQKAGGKSEFSKYYTASHGHAILAQSLRKNLVFAQHNLVTDGSPNEFNVILCRNVMIYFNLPLQQRVHKLFHDSLVPFGILALGRRESLGPGPVEGCYEALDRQERLYKRVG